MVLELGVGRYATWSDQKTTVYDPLNPSQLVVRVDGGAAVSPRPSPPGSPELSAWESALNRIRARLRSAHCSHSSDVDYFKRPPACPEWPALTGEQDMAVNLARRVACRQHRLGERLNTVQLTLLGIAASGTLAPT